MSSKWLKSSVGAERLYTLELKSVKNCFDGDALWHREYRNDKEIFELTTKNTNNRLKKALNDHMFETHYTNEKGKVNKKECIFSNVIVRIPKLKYNEDIKNNGKKIIKLKERLIELHDNDFKAKTMKNQRPHYVIDSHDDEEDKVVFQFGTGVFIPFGGEQSIGEIQIKTKNNSWQSLPEWHFWQQIGEIKRASNLYVGQEDIIISNNYKNGSICVPDFFSSDDAWIHINCITKKVYGDGKHLTEHSIITDKNNTAEYELKEISGEKNIVLLKWITDDKLSAPCVYLAGYAFMKLEKIDWFIWIDKDCMPCSESESNLTFWGINDRVCYIQSDSKKTYSDIVFTNGMANISGLEITLPPEDLKHKYNGFLMIPYNNNEKLAEISAGKINYIGRSLTDNPQKSKPEIALDFFTQTESVRGKQGLSLGQIGVSRKHATLTWQSSTEKIFVQQLSSSAYLFILKIDGQLIQLEPKSGKEVEVDKGDKLIIGTFILEIGSQRSHGTIAF